MSHEDLTCKLAYVFAILAVANIPNLHICHPRLSDMQGYYDSEMDTMMNNPGTRVEFITVVMPLYFAIECDNMTVNEIISPSGFYHHQAQR